MYIYIYIEVSINGGTPKPSILMGFSLTKTHQLGVALQLCGT